MDAALKELTGQEGRQFKKVTNAKEGASTVLVGFRESSERFLEKVIVEEPFNGWIVLLIHLVVKSILGWGKSKGKRKTQSWESTRCTCLDHSRQGRIVENKCGPVIWDWNIHSLECLPRPCSHGKFVSKGMCSDLCFRKMNHMDWSRETL